MSNNVVTAGNGVYTLLFAFFIPSCTLRLESDFMKQINYDLDNQFILHQPFFHDGVKHYHSIMYTKPYQALFYEFQTSSNPRVNQQVTYIPSGCMDILFILGNRGECFIEILGSGTQAKQIQRYTNASYFGIRLKPGMFLAYHGMSLRDLVDQDLLFDLSDLDPEDIMSAFVQDLVKCSALQAKAKLFLRYFNNEIKVTDVNDLTGYVLSEINSTQGSVRIHELAEDLHYSERHIARIFQDSMGITPKTFARIVRFQNVVNSILSDPQYTLCEYMSELGYSDQAHFQREFKQYSGITPKRFLAYAQEQADFFTKELIFSEASKEKKEVG